MLTRFDDYPIHQTPEPVAHPFTGDLNFYDRYFFNGHTPDGELFFAAAFGLYPNRRVMDAAVSIVRGGRQYALRASRLAPLERSDLRVGPIAVEVEEPMTALRVRVAPNEHGIEADLRFLARAAPLEEPRFTRQTQGRTTMDVTRYDQFGVWEGTLTVAGETITLDPASARGCRDRSWGVRGVGERTAGAPAGGPGQFYWLWTALDFGDVCLHFTTNEDSEGRAWHRNAVLAPAVEAGTPTGDATPERMDTVDHRVEWESGTRRARGAEITLHPHDGAPRVITVEPLFHFQMNGLGYGHPEWGHGMWKGEDEITSESWALTDVDPRDPRQFHIQSFCRARMGDREGTGVLEQLVVGPHTPSGFREAADPAP